MNIEKLDAYQGKRILITGGAGYLGTNLAKALAHMPCTLVRLDRPAATFAPVAGRAEVQNITGDVRERALWADLIDGVDVIFHFAAQTSVYVANDDPVADQAMNVSPLLSLLEACRRTGRQPGILFSGTVTEAGLTTRLPVDESQPDDPITVYDLHKLTAERYLKWYASEGLVKGATLRLANVYGPGPTSSSADRGVLNQMIRKALGGETLTIFGQGQQIRDYVFIDDVVSAFLMAGLALDKISGRHYVIGSGVATTFAQAIHTVAAQVALRTGRRAEVVHIDPPRPQSPIEARNFVAATARMQRDTDWQACWSLDQGIVQTIKWYLENQGEKP